MQQINDDFNSADLKCFLTEGLPIAELRVTDQPVLIPVLIVSAVMMTP